ncbi:hypothetical protein EOD41_14290 [Mucilaginibacter limnophilus]|uniref:Uncharacterized protein n=1 Tax=Mucilaginibacter limnophilus TaxID=1932778 RepID=A0A437MR47_9SPHI|nr:hypothetical protein [Mucilaginibacter limnophilus]RVU00125.1 hypothetical protein EOD41_14290 [Mucilaginibacter limnophilus]
MRAGVIFILSLCFLLLRGYNYTYARVHHDKLSYSPAPDVTRTQKVTPVDISKATTVKKSSKLNTDKDFIFNIEDDDDNFVFARKYVLLANWVSILSCIFLLSIRPEHLKERLPFGRYLSGNSSPKYIVQRVIRL